LTGALKSKDWAVFARRYNGPGYQANAYDKKLARAYLLFLRDNPDAAQPTT